MKRYKIKPCPSCGHGIRHELTAAEIGAKGGAGATGDKKRRTREHYQKMQRASEKSKAENKLKNNENKS